MEFGIGVLLDNMWIIGMVLPIIIILTFTVILNEEYYLAEKFGEEYLKYKISVRRWL
jgi:protein-S-isoprenylcysteine O-methyltransferase Ste14